MQYREFGKTGEKVSILGYGCMRFPRRAGRIDEERTLKQLSSAVERGVNYFDTAYVYPGSEAALGRILGKTGLRSKVLIATKLPSFMMRAPKDMENTLNTSLERLGTDHIDFYLMHNLTSTVSWQKLRDLGVEDFLERVKKQGKVRFVGFSYHGDRPQFPQIVDSYPWDFCQIQYNFLDEDFQAGTPGLLHAASKGLGVVAMEPLRGGLLGGKAPQAVQEVWDSAETKRSPAEWALRWVWNHPEVATVLSGMNDEAHIDENIRISSGNSGTSSQFLSEQELALFEKVKAVFAEKTKVGCTGCAYCMPCPAGVDIPACFKYYNDRYLFDDKGFRLKYASSLIGLDGGGPKYASRCRDCGKCETHCPQGIPIRRRLKEVAGDMEGFYLKPLAKGAQWYFNRKKPKKTEQEK